MDELVKRLREEAECPDNFPEDSNLMREAADAIEELEMCCDRIERDYKALCNYLPKWISVKERLPEERMAVFVYAPNYRNIFMGYLTDDGWKTWAARNGGYDWPTVHEITHWMPLPEPPKEET